MRKIFLLLMIFMIASVQNCFAATIEAKYFNGDEKLIYPVVSSGDEAIDREINVKIIAEVDRFLTGVYRNAQINGYKVADARTSYEIGSNQAGGTIILSIIMTESQYFKGAAHPATWKHALNFNLANGEQIGKNYLLEVGSGVSESDFIERLEQKLREKKILLFEDALPLKKLPEDFYWDENLHLHFIFQHYEVAPYAAGIIDVDIDA